ncbi:MAG: protein kinase [Deltaproteobacteria bacterium]|nr:protein kinase [Deltaproteobacteria bacterium]
MPERCTISLLVFQTLEMTSSSNHDAQVERLVAEGKIAQAAAMARARGLLVRARELYEKLWDFRAAAACAHEQGDRVAELRNLLDAGARREAEGLLDPILGSSEEERRLAAQACESRRAAPLAARLYESLGEMARTAALLENAGLLFDAAQAWEKAGDLPSAVRQYERIALDHPQGPERATAHLELGKVLGRLGDHEKAAEHLQEAMRHGAGDPRTAATARARLVIELAEMGMRSAARDVLLAARGQGSTVPTDLDEYLLREARAPEADEEKVLGRYRVVRPLGSGGAGLVVLARDSLTGREVALKRLHASVGSQGVAVERFAREARIMSASRHPHVATIFELRDDLGILVMEYMGGGTLEDKLARRLSPNSARRIALEVLSALSHAHSRGVVHRDLKPSNIFFDERDVAKVGDFGMAHLLELGQTQAGALFGSLAYLAPEQITHAQVTYAADLYALGVVLFRALTGRLPFLGPDFVAQHLGEEPLAVSSACEALGTTWDAVLARLLTKDPLARPASAHEVAEEIAAIRATTEVPLAMPRVALPEPRGAKAPQRGSPPEVRVPAEPLEPSNHRLAGECRIGDTPISTLWRAVDVALERSVVLERFQPGEPDPSTASRLLALAAHGGSFLQRVLSFHRDEGVAVLEAPVGETAHARQGTLTMLGAARLLTDLGRALLPVHEAGGVHGKVDAAHVLIAEDGTPTLLVAGLGRHDARAKPEGDARACLEVAALLAGVPTWEDLHDRFEHELGSGVMERLRALPVANALDLLYLTSAIEEELARAAQVAGEVERWLGMCHDETFLADVRARALRLGMPPEKVREMTRFRLRGS